MLMSQTLTYVLLLANRANRKQSVSDLIGYEHFLNTWQLRSLKLWRKKKLCVAGVTRKR